MAGSSSSSLSDEDLARIVKAFGQHYGGSSSLLFGFHFWEFVLGILVAAALVLAVGQRCLDFAVSSSTTTEACLAGLFLLSPHSAPGVVTDAARKYNPGKSSLFNVTLGLLRGFISCT